MKTDITVVLDRSGSMADIADDIVGGLNEFVAKQKALEGEAHFTLVQFDDEYEVVHFRVPIGEVPPLTRQTYVPRGMTALLDAIGRTINEINARMDRMRTEERPDQIVFAVATDGQENSSHEFTRRQIFSMIRSREKLAQVDPSARPTWEFVFLGANQDAIEEGGQMGFAAARAVDFDADAGGVHAAMSVMHSKIALKRSMGHLASMDFASSERSQLSRKKRKTN
ncbi:vWA domain-containing protein [Luteitalea sp. TBR-22]|uniref:vWA domain-containing protein n=1 Tax=Luteitalea sp. TBR-22 TaxID=2802971 RepID=UPI001EF553AF|nr:vWA domain-containing protein [Luteitalea sp. TBR-22]